MRKGAQSVTANRQYLSSHCNDKKIRVRRREGKEKKKKGSEAK